MAIEMVQVESSNIKEIGYDPEAKILRVTFHKGSATYDYAGVPEETWKAMMVSESKGAFLQRQVMKKFEYRKLD